MGRLVDDKVEALRKRAQREIDEGLLPSCQIALGLNGEIVFSETFGDATPDSRYIVFSSTKAFVAGAMWVLIGEGQVDVATKVADLIPEFGTNGKEVITIEQVMLHTSGFPMAPLGHPQWLTRDGRLEAFSKWRLNWEPGTAFEYHPTSAHWVLAELIERVSGIDYRDFVEQRVTAPNGLPRVLGIPVDQQQGVTELEVRGEPPSPDELEKLFGVRELPVGEVTNDALLGFNLPEVRAGGVPGGGGVMRAVDLAMYYQALLHNPAGVWDADVLHDVTTNVRNSYPDPLLHVPANRSLGLVIAGGDGRAHLRGGNFGKTVSAGAFGHAGAAGQIAWADPATGLSLGYCTNGIDANVLRENRRSTAIASIAGECATRD
jgi:CubicO group peptidase (beta-lactamase class C family)